MEGEQARPAEGWRTSLALSERGARSGFCVYLSTGAVLDRAFQSLSGSAGRTPKRLTLSGGGRGSPTRAQAPATY